MHVPYVKPSIQKLVGGVAQDALSFLTEEAVHTVAYVEDTPDLNDALEDLASQFSSSVSDAGVIPKAIQKAQNLADVKRKNHRDTVRAMLSWIADVSIVAPRSWKYWRLHQDLPRMYVDAPNRSYTLT